jgi:hypothetical protein
MPWFWIPLAILLVVALVVAWFYDRRHRARGDLIEGGGTSRRDAANDARTRLNEIDDGSGP